MFLHHTLVAIEERKTKLSISIDEECNDSVTKVTTSSGFSEPQPSTVRRDIVRVDLQIDGRAKDCLKLENEKKILAFHK